MKHGQHCFSILIVHMNEHRISSEYGIKAEIQKYKYLTKMSSKQPKLLIS